MTGTTIRIGLGKFGTVISEGLLQILGQGGNLSVVGAQLDPHELQAIVARRSVDVLLLDDTRVVGHSHLYRLRNVDPSLGLIVMTNAPTGAYSRRLLAAGVNACLSKETTDTELLSTVWLAASGKYVINPTTASHGQTRRVIEAQPLTPREEDVFTLLRLGRTNAAIAQELHISVETVRTHSTHVYRKLQVRTRRELHGIELTQHEPPL